jgi:hypothetical protein
MYYHNRIPQYICWCCIIWRFSKPAMLKLCFHILCSNYRSFGKSAEKMRMFLNNGFFPNGFMRAARAATSRSFDPRPNKERTIGLVGIHGKKKQVASPHKARSRNKMPTIAIIKTRPAAPESGTLGKSEHGSIFFLSLSTPRCRWQL